MSVIAKLTGKKVKCSGELPLRGTKEIYDYLITKDKSTLSSLSIINYYSKTDKTKVSSTRFELVIGDNSSANNWAVSPRIIASTKNNGVEYTVEFLATNEGSYSLDRILREFATTKYANNGSDLYVFNRDELLRVLKALFKECPKK